VKIAFVLIASKEREILKLTIELVPSTVWESSLYGLMTKEVWNSTSIAVFHLMALQSLQLVLAVHLGLHRHLATVHHRQN